MQSFKVFFITFTTSLCIVMCGFAALYWVNTPSAQSVDSNHSGVPTGKAQSADNKTTLLCLQTDNNLLFFVIKLNAVDNMVTVAALPQQYYLSNPGRTLAQSFEYAGIMQCVQDLGRNLDIVIDYHLLLDSSSLPKFTADFEDIAFDISSLSSLFPSLSGNSLADITSFVLGLTDNCNSEILQFTADIISHIIHIHSSVIINTTLELIPQKLGVLNTNIGKTEATQLKRIIFFLQQNNCHYNSFVLSDGQISAFYATN